MSIITRRKISIATVETAFVRSAVLAADFVNLIILAVVVRYAAHDYVDNVKKVRSHNQLVDLNHEIASKMVLDVLHIEEVYEVSSTTN